MGLFSKKVVPAQDTSGVAYDTLPYEIEETDKWYVINIFAPGMDKSAFEINLSERGISVYGERNHQFATSAHVRANFTLTEEFAVPIYVNSASAAYVDGVLTITVPKALSTRVVKLQVA